MQGERVVYSGCGGLQVHRTPGSRPAEQAGTREGKSSRSEDHRSEAATALCPPLTRQPILQKIPFRLTHRGNPK
jgi:hypothetical protein